jgi:hypothetical protein
MMDDERARLQATYSRFLDAELERAAAESANLTDLARDVLFAEMGRRGLNLEVAKIESNVHSPDPDAAPGVTVRRFRDLPEALLAKGSLESAGIACMLLDDNMVRMDWFLSNSLGGMRLQVNPQDMDAAQSILNQPIPEDLEVPGSGDYQQPRCPKCRSLDVSFRELVKPVAYISAYLGIPIPLERAGWRCHSCHLEWEEPPSASPVEG